MPDLKKPDWVAVLGRAATDESFRKALLSGDKKTLSAYGLTKADVEKLGSMNQSAWDSLRNGLAVNIQNLSCCPPEYAVRL